MPRRINRLKLPPLKPIKKNVLLETNAEETVEDLGEPKDYVRLSPEVDFVIQAKRSHWIKKKLEKKREETKSQIQDLVNQWRSLEQKELVFQRTIVAHNRFVKRNLEKRERALVKLQTDAELVKKRVRDLKTLSQKYSLLKESLVKMRDEIVKHSIYEAYLESVLRHGDCPFKMLFEFLTKFEVLLEVKEYCMKRQNNEMSITIQMKGVNMEHFRHQQIVFIGYRNEVNNLCAKYDDILRRNLASEALLRRVIIKTNDLNNDVESCQQTINTIYKYICHRRGISPGVLEMSVIEPKVDVISHTLESYAKMMPILEMKKKSKSNQKSQQLYKFSQSKDESSLYGRKYSKRHSSKDYRTVLNSMSELT